MNSKAKGISFRYFDVLKRHSLSDTLSFPLGVDGRGVRGCSAYVNAEILSNASMAGDETSLNEVNDSCLSSELQP